MVFLVLLAALLPVAIWLFYIFRKDKDRPEPVWQLVKGFVFGAISVALSFGISIPLGLTGLYTMEPYTVWDSIALSFFGAAIPEECAKFLMLWLLLRKNKYFDEKMDGVVYAVCVSLGFAAVENIMYLFSYYDSFVSVGVSRALFSIPGHFMFGVLMGYYYSLAKFYPKSPKKNHVLVLAAPIIAHGVFDSLLFISDVAPAFSGVLTIVFLFFCYKMWKYARKRIHEHLDRDRYVPID